MTDRVSRVALDVGPQECWWGGNVSQGHLMPLTAQTPGFDVNLLGDNKGNQSQPVLLSSQGRAIWCEAPIAIHLAQGRLTVESSLGEVHLEPTDGTLAGAHRCLVERFYRFNGQFPREEMFARPQFNTWIELMYDQNERDILRYAQAVVDNGYAPGVLMIDDNWQEDYGVWEFSPRRFTDPKAMVGRLHELGFKVILWVCPFVSADSTVYRELSRKKALIRDAVDQQDVLWSVTNAHPAIIRWWNGASAALDLSHPQGQAWFRAQLDRLMRDYGVDGFKFDAGDARFYIGQIASENPNWHANDHMEAFARLAADYPFTELRACWKLGGWPLGQRLRDKGHNWKDLQCLIPDTILQGLLGYPYNCPDMIGGGEYQSFLRAESIDQELFVRSAQCSALMPMMQFSAAPWRVLDGAHAALCKAAADLHMQHAGEILDLARRAAATGQPIVRSLAYQFPGQPGLERLADQFMLGDTLLVAPVLEKGASARQVVLPPGLWEGDRGEAIQGPCTASVPAPLDRLPRFRLRRQP